MLDLPLGPTDVALGCVVLFFSHALNRARGRRTAAIAFLGLASACVSAGCSQREPDAVALPAVRDLNESTVWIAKIRNSTNLELRVPAANPLRSLAEMAGKLSADNRPTVMDLLRDALQAELDRRKLKVAFPEAHDARLGTFSSDPASASRVAREGQLSGLLLITDIQRWNADGRQILSSRVAFKLLRISDGRPVWERTVRRVVATTGAAHLGQASNDAVRDILREIFGT